MTGSVTSFVMLDDPDAVLAFPAVSTIFTVNDLAPSAPRSVIDVPLPVNVYKVDKATTLTVTSVPSKEPPAYKCAVPSNSVAGLVKVRVKPVFVPLI